MTKAGQKILEGAREALAYARGELVEGVIVHVPETVDVKAIRKKLGKTQQQFARDYGLGYDAVRDWEAGRRQPERTARLLLRVIEREPEAVQRALKVA